MFIYSFFLSLCFLALGIYFGTVLEREGDLDAENKDFNRQEIFIERSSPIGLQEGYKDIVSFINGDEILQGVPGEEKQGFEIIFSNKFIIRNIELEFAFDQYWAEEFTIEIWNGDSWEILIDEEFQPMLYSRFYWNNFDEGVEMLGIRFTSYKYHDIEYLAIRNINFNTTPLYFSDKYINSSDDLLEVIFGDKWVPIDQLTTHQKIVKMMEWIGNNIENGVCDSDPYLTLKNKTGACGNRATLLATLTEHLGLESRFIQLCNWPKMGMGHVVNEIFYDGQWRLYDPSYCAYYVKNQEDMSNRVDPFVVSFKELKDNPQIADRNSVVSNARFLYMTTFPEAGGQNKRGYYTSGDTFRNANPSGPYGPDIPMYFPAEFDLGNGKIAVDKKNGMPISGIPGENPMMLYLLGSAYINVNHKYTLNSLEEGKSYKVTLGILGSTVENFQVKIRYEGLKGSQTQEIISRETKEIQFEFKAIENNGYLTLYHEYTGGEEYLTLEFIEITKIDE